MKSFSEEKKSEREKDEKNIYICASLSKDGRLDFPENVSAKHLEKIIFTLGSDAHLLFIKHPKENMQRIDDIKKCIKNLQENKNSLTYDLLDQSLENLQNKLFSNNGFTKMFKNEYDKSHQHVVEAREESRELQRRLRPG